MGVEERRQPLDCAALVAHAVKCATKRVGYLPGVSGEVGKGLTVDPTYRRNPDAAIPIDALLNVLLEGVDGDFVDAVAAAGAASGNALGATPALPDLGDGRGGLAGPTNFLGAVPTEAGPPNFLGAVVAAAGGNTSGSGNASGATPALPDLGDCRGGLACPTNNLPDTAEEDFRLEDVFGDEVDLSDDGGSDDEGSEGGVAATWSRMLF